MPHQTRMRRQEQTITTITKDGEITINLNLNLTIDGGSLRVDAKATAERVGVQPVVEQEEEKKRLELVPTELFSAGDELIDGFGGKS